MRDEDLIPLSALQHLAFCERQCALIHVEREWAENRLTAEGRTLHERVDEGYREYRRGLRQFSGVHVRNLRLGIYGQLDVVEGAVFRRSGKARWPCTARKKWRVRTACCMAWCRSGQP